MQNRPSARPSIRPCAVRPPVRLSVRTSVRPSVRPPVRPPVRLKNKVCFFAKDRAKIISLCFWPQKFSMRTLKINLVHLIQTKIYKKIQKCVTFVKKAKLTPNFPSITREIRCEFGLFNENDTFLDFLIDF